LKAANGAEPGLKLAVPVGATLFDGRIEVDDLVLDTDLVNEGLELEDVVRTGGL
jgi:hypothetical protein